MFRIVTFHQHFHGPRLTTHFVVQKKHYIFSEKKQLCVKVAEYFQIWLSLWTTVRAALSYRTRALNKPLVLASDPPKLWRAFPTRLKIDARILAASAVHVFAISFEGWPASVCDVALAAGRTVASFILPSFNLQTSLGPVPDHLDPVSVGAWFGLLMHISAFCSRVRLTRETKCHLRRRPRNQ